MRKENSPDYELFYVELPQTTDYLNDIEIQDEYEEPKDGRQGLSDAQVSEIAQDSLKAVQNTADNDYNTEPFSPDPNANPAQ